ncbi:MAG TPA: TonB-dependent receptor [Chryseolinea sp.]
MKQILLALVLISNLALAQKFSLQGLVADSAGTWLSSATVMLLNPKDSALVNFTVTNDHGRFEMKNLSRTGYLLKVTFVGYKTFSKEIPPEPSAAVLDVGILQMTIARTTLDEVVVSETIPVVVKRDTIEFDAGAFKTNKNATVEELLKKLPGVEVDSEGNVKAQGEQVERVTVDGKDFFGGRDPKIATRNLPADAIDKVQVLDRKSDQALFSGVDDGQREKAINLELKEEKRHGAFGNLLGGYGTDQRYQAKANINRFDNGKQLSFLAMANNLNERGFSIDDYMNFTGGSQQMMGGGQVRIRVDGDSQNGIPLNLGNRANGIFETYAGGLNFSNALGKETDVNGSYFYNFLDHDKVQAVSRENFLQDGNFFYEESTSQDNTNENHRANVTLDHRPDSANAIRFSSNFSYNETTADVHTVSRNKSPEGDLLNENLSHSFSDGTTVALNSTLLLRHKFEKKGRNFSANFQLSLSESQRDGWLDAVYRYEGDTTSTMLRQRNEQTNKSLLYGANLTYTEPIGNRKYLEGTYSFRQNNNDVSRPVYDMFQDQETLNDSLSNWYDSDYRYHKAGMNFRVNRRKYTFNVGAAIQETHLTGNLKVQDADISRTFRNFLPVIRLNYDFSSSRHLRFDYETSVQEPTIQQLQPVIDNRDPLNPYRGNPALRPAYLQSWRANFASFDPASFIGFFAFVDVDYTTNAITNAVSNDNFVRTTMPVNVTDNIRINADATVSFPINKLKSRINFSANVRNEQGTNIIDEVQYDIRQRTFGGNFRYSYRYNDIFDLSLSADFDQQKAVYEFDQPDQKFLNQTYTAETNLTVKKKNLLSGTFEYLIYEGKSVHFYQTIPLLNLSVSRYILKNNSGEIKLSVNNLLDKALGINQTATVNYVERTVTNSLGRYFMLTFTYALNKQLNPMGGMRRGGGMMRIIR